MWGRWGEKGAEEERNSRNSLLTQGAQGTQKERKRFLGKRGAHAGEEGRCGGDGAREFFGAYAIAVLRGI